MGHSTFIFCHCKVTVISHAQHIKLLSFFLYLHYITFPSDCFNQIIVLSVQVLSCPLTFLSVVSPPGEVTPPVAPPAVPSDAAGGVDINSYPRPAVTRKAKVLYDYDASEKNELSLLADEV